MVGFKTETDTAILGKTESSVLTGAQVGFEAALGGPKVSRSLNNAIFKLFLTGLLNDSQCDVGGRSGARGKLHCRRLSNGANKPLHNGRLSSRRRP